MLLQGQGVDEQGEVGHLSVTRTEEVHEEKSQLLVMPSRTDAIQHRPLSAVCRY